MSYNIDVIKIREIDLRVERSILEQAYQKDREKNYHELKFGINEWSWEIGEREGIKGGYLLDYKTKEPCHLCGNPQKISVLTITKIDVIGYGSGRSWNEIVLPFLKNTRGTFKALMVWEKGDTVCEFELIDGVVKEIDL